MVSTIPSVHDATRRGVLENVESRVENTPADRRRSPFKPVRNAPSLLRGMNFRVLDSLPTSPFDLRCCSRVVFRFLVFYSFYGDYTAFSSPFRYGV